MDSMHHARDHLNYKAAQGHPSQESPLRTFKEGTCHPQKPNLDRHKRLDSRQRQHLQAGRSALAPGFQFTGTCEEHRVRSPTPYIPKRSNSRSTRRTECTVHAATSILRPLENFLTQESPLRTFNWRKQSERVNLSLQGKAPLQKSNSKPIICTCTRIRHIYLEATRRCVIRSDMRNIHTNT